MKTHKSLIGLCLVALLSGCGGGGGSVEPSGPVTSTLSFPVQSAWGAYVAAGTTKSFVISGTCSGTASATQSAAAGGATFEGVTGRLSATRVFTMSLSNCTPASSAVTTTLYFDTNYVPLGSSTVGTNYGVYLVPPTIPPSVMVGGAGILGTATLYTNSTKSVAAGRVDASYVVEADTASTVIFNLIAKVYNVAGVLTATEQDRYRIGATGALTLVSIDTQAANGSTTHLVFQ